MGLRSACCAELVLWNFLQRTVLGSAAISLYGKLFGMLF